MLIKSALRTHHQDLLFPPLIQVSVAFPEGGKTLEMAVFQPAVEHLDPYSFDS